jgi:hypothetical protein
LSGVFVRFRAAGYPSSEIVSGGENAVFKFFFCKDSGIGIKQENQEKYSNLLFRRIVLSHVNLAVQGLDWRFLIQLLGYDE